LRAKTCKECITSAADCFWCAEENLGINRCNEKGSMPQSTCPKHEIYVAKNEFIASNDKEFSKTIGATIQLKPQKYKISLKPNSQVVIPIYFQRAEDYPMDLYYLMDLSNTMKKHKEKLAEVGQKIAAAIKKTTKNFRIGFGSFVDKPVMPYSYYDNEFSISCLYLEFS
jgi:protocadherin alpha